MISPVNIVVDFETYSPVDITCGPVKYASHKDADIVCMSFKVNDNPVRRWVPGAEPIPSIFYHEANIYAHNAFFDYCIWFFVGVSKYKFPLIKLSSWTDTKALAQRYTYPGALAKVGDVLELEVVKDKRGKALIKKICLPTKSGRRPRINMDFTHQDLDDFYDYCDQDVEATYALINALPSRMLSEDEQRLWVMTQSINLRGLPIDVECVDKILSYIEYYIDDQNTQLPLITDGAVTKITQLKRMKDWMATKDVHVTDMQALTLESLLAGELPEDVRKLLVMRQQMGMSSTAKYKKLRDSELDGRFHGSLTYHGTNTGRWVSNFLHTLPRVSMNEPDKIIEKFMTFQSIEDPVTTAKALIRPMIKAPEGSQLIVSDYSSIENRLLAWVAGDEKSLRLFRSKGDQYVDMAASLYGVDPADVTSGQRQMGKVVILGCGFGMGPDRFRETAASWGMNVTAADAATAVSAYRTKYKLVQRLWYKLKDAAMAATVDKGNTYGYNGCSFRFARSSSGSKWLVLTLPSGRSIYYCNPDIEDGKYGAAVVHEGVNPYSKKWGRMALIPGRITENVMQALARDVMAQGMTNITNYMKEVALLGSVHDEVLGEIRIKDIHHHTMVSFNTRLCDMPEWANGLPLEADGYMAERYRKG